ncbi:hypothetical protein DMC30DRAFT_398667 [Rhodotorula diobovata]|uniref:F-box domain-containing protein n=1 Tax=Rhodotorula diobovata TaxID=5288 RepID=A0A5C5FTG7_9BASI|nr:hypothetical protein DMC30DRAFT_398667 [Rhodotorula diobovata]
MLPRSLPVELLKQILANDVLEQADLAACCLASRTFLAIARPLLYEAKALHLWRNKRATRKTWAWCSTIRATPEVAALVRKVRLIVPSAGLSWPRDEHVPTDAETPTLISEVLEKCTHLEHLLGLEGSLHWKLPEPRPFLATLRSLFYILFDDDAYSILCHTPNLQHLGLTLGHDWRVGVDPGAPAPTFSLSSLSLVGGFWNERSAEVFSVTLAKSHASLRSLQVPTSDVVKGLVDIAAFTSLETVSLSSAERDASAAHLLSKCGDFKTLQLRDVAGMTDEDDPALLPDLPLTAAALPASLKRIELPTSFGAYSGAVERLVDALPSHVRLDTLGVVPRRRHCEGRDGDEDQGDHDHEDKEWVELDKRCRELNITLVESRGTILPEDLLVADER